MSDDEPTIGIGWKRNSAATVPVVARPQTFLGGPGAITKIADLMAVLLVMTFWFIYEPGALWMFSFMPVHGICVLVGIYEPHFDTVVSAWTRIPRHSRADRAGRRRFPGAKHIIEP